MSAALVAWMEATFPTLRESVWRPALHVNGVDVLDALLSPLYMALLPLTRALSGEPPAPAPRTRVPGFIRERRWPYAAHEWRARLLSARPDPAPVIFWPREPTHLKAQIPAARALHDQGVTSGFVVDFPPLFGLLRQRRTPAIFADRAWADPVRRVLIAGQAETAMLRADPGVTLPPFPGEIAPQAVIHALRHTLIQLLPVVHKTAAITETMLHTLKPDVLVVGNDITPEGRTATLSAQQAGLPTVCLMHGAAVDPLQRLHRVDQMLVYGQRDRDLFMEQGADPAQIVVIGAPYLDDLPSQSRHLHPAIRARLHLSDDRPLILVATSGAGNTISLPHHLLVIETIMRLSAKLTAFDFVARLHRKDRRDYYDQIRQRVPESRLHVVPNNARGFPADIFDWLQGNAVLLTGASTVAIEAMLMEVPVITMDLAGELRQISFIDAGATQHVTTAEQLEDAICRTIQTPDQSAEMTARAQAFLKDTFYALDRQSARRCADEICRLGGFDRQ